ncbi:MAG: type II CRISPR RNA-guided endonuclease Cas9, partial [Clostridia bacterium]|nr:type II CRISPR RNA-guided endonuclease Cas9 [Clostridia bacterium]
MKNEKYFLGLDIGTDSVGYAVTDTSPEYKLLKHRGEPMWGVSLFDAAETKAKRRSFRTARRRLDRRQQRVSLVQELFAEEIGKVDPGFYRRIRESALLRTDAEDPHCLFVDEKFKDKDYHKIYPTIHHLIMDLIENKKPHDVRLVYLACAWLVAHRGHFLFEISTDADYKPDFNAVYEPLITFFESLPLDNYCAPWVLKDRRILEDALKKKTPITIKSREVEKALFPDGKSPKGIPDTDAFPFAVDGIVKLLAGGKVKLSALFGKEEYADLETSSINLGMDDEKLEEILHELGDDGELIVRLKAIYDWAILCDLLKGQEYISQSKVEDYNQHKADLHFLKHFVKKYVPGKYADVFRKIVNDNYVAYSGNIKSVKGDVSGFKKNRNKEDFYKFITGIVKDVDVDDADRAKYNDMIERLGAGTFMPKQVTGDNRVIPYQLYYKELKAILDNACSYLPFLSATDPDGYVTKDKLLSIMGFRIPYYVGPLNVHSEHAWIVKKGEGKIYPWNFEAKVDLDASEQRFIDRMLNKCTYLPGCDVLPKSSLLYEKFEVLNEINKIRINGSVISVDAKQGIVHDLFMQRKRVTVKMIRDYLAGNGFCTKEDSETISGIDVIVKSSMSSHIAFRAFLSDKRLNTDEVEEIIERATFSEDKRRFARWLGQRFTNLPVEDRKYICSLNFNDFGNLSKELLSGIEGAKKDTGEADTVIGFMWKTNVNFMELMSDRFSFRETIDEYAREYYSEHPSTLESRLDEMFISNSVKRPIYRTLDIIRDVVKAQGRSPEKIFIEMARGGDPNSKGKRTKSRKQQILDLYSKVKDEDIKHLYDQLNGMGDSADNRLQSEALFLYYIQLGRCMYSGEPLDVDKLGDGSYNIDHIWPQSKVKDDSLLNNKVLVLSKFNKDKGDSYPVPAEWRSKMYPIWKRLKESGLMTEEKFERLTRKTPFTPEEAWGFINRQLVETRQSTKAIATLLKEKYPDTEIVYVKAGLVSDFRHEYGLLKCRSVNDLHHAKDAYLNVVCGNVYNEHFTRSWFIKANESGEKYNLKLGKLLGELVTEDERIELSDGRVYVRKVAKHDKSGIPMFSGKTVRNRATVVWDGEKSFSSVRAAVLKNAIHITYLSTIRKSGQNGGLFNQNPVKAEQGFVPRKIDLRTEVYGGYSDETTAFDVLVEVTNGKKKVVRLVPVLLKNAEEFLLSEEKALTYLKDIMGEQTGSKIHILLDGRVIKMGTVFEIDGLRMILGSHSIKDGRIGL